MSPYIKQEKCWSCCQLCLMVGITPGTWKVLNKCKPLPSGRMANFLADRPPVSAPTYKVNILLSADPVKPHSPESGPNQKCWSFPVIFSIGFQGSQAMCHIFTIFGNQLEQAGILFGESTCFCICQSGYKRLLKEKTKSGCYRRQSG